MVRTLYDSRKTAIIHQSRAQTNPLHLRTSVPDFVTTFLSSNPDINTPLRPRLTHTITSQAGDMPLLSQLDIEQRYTQQLPAHCYLNIQVLDDSSTELASGHNLNSRSQQFKQAHGRPPAITEDVNLYALPPTLFYTEFYSHQSKYPLTQILRPHRNSLIYPGWTNAT